MTSHPHSHPARAELATDQPSSFRPLGLSPRALLAGGIAAALLAGAGLFMALSGDDATQSAPVVSTPDIPAQEAPQEPERERVTLETLPPGPVSDRELIDLNADLPREIMRHLTLVEIRRGDDLDVVVEVLKIDPQELFLIRNRLNQRMSAEDRALCWDDPRKLAARAPHETVLLTPRGVKFGDLPHWMMVCPNGDISGRVKF